ncbi:MAG: NusG domain II-containing protein [Clostridiales bacterium]|jgi:hypothetical protein|nr:NusG domain II-containing protein [Clostridiales bacterium]
MAKSFDIKLICALCIAALVFFLAERLFAGEGGRAVIRVGGETAETLPLPLDAEYTGGGVVVEIKGGKAGITRSTCPNQLCVRQGFTDSPSKPLVCLPNKVSVTIEKAGAPEGVDDIAW